MYAFVLVETADGRRVRLGHGDFIGRLWSATLAVDDPRVSEAHAMVSLRLGELRLLALRGRFFVGRKRVADIRLTAGLELTLTKETRLRVLEVVLPRQLLGVEGDDLPRQILPGVCGLMLEPRPTLVAPMPADPDVAFWNNGSGWRFRPRASAAAALLDGDEWRVGDHTFRAVAMEMSSLGDGATMVDGGLEQPLTIVANYDTVHIHSGRPKPAVISGIGARLLSELALIGGPVEWRILAREVWGDLAEGSLRRRLDVAANRLRTRLRELGVRPDLIRATGTGHYELFLHQRDQVQENV